LLRSAARRSPPERHRPCRLPRSGSRPTLKALRWFAVRMAASERRHVFMAMAMVSVAVMATACGAAATPTDIAGAFAAGDQGKGRRLRCGLRGVLRDQFVSRSFGIQSRLSPSSVHARYLGIHMTLTGKILGSVLILAVSYIGTLFAIDAYDPDFNGPWKRDRQRANDAVALKAAMEAYKKSKGSYPDFPDNNTDDLAPVLVGGKFLASIPRDPIKGVVYRITSRATVYGLLFQLERPPGRCMTGVGISGSGAWGGPPDCPF
jgi:hypothetical protein